jgi:hypothetical protein
MDGRMGAATGAPSSSDEAHSTRASRVFGPQGNPRHRYEDR